MFESVTLGDVELRVPSFRPSTVGVGVGGVGGLEENGCHANGVLAACYWNENRQFGHLTHISLGGGGGGGVSAWTRWTCDGQFLYILI